MKFLHNIGRIEAFSDAVFAFAATLLVISLNDENTISVLKIDLVNFAAFLISFFVLVLLWKVHYNFFRRTDYIDNWVIALNSILLFVVLYFVFPLKSMINSWFGALQMTPEKLAALFELYGLAFLLIFLCIALMYYRVKQKTSEKNNKLVLLFYQRHYFIFVIVAALSILISISRIGLSFGFPGFMYGLLGPFCYFHSQWFIKKYGVI